MQSLKKEKLVVGVVSYGGGLVGWVRDGQEGEFEKKFAVRHHNGPVRSIAAVSRPEVMSAKAKGNLQRARASHAPAAHLMRLESNARAFMATGGQDETIQLYDLTKLKILGNLHQHNNEVTAIAFFRSKNMLSADADGVVNVWRCYDWQLLESMTGHKGRVNCISIHPTGAMALTCSADKTVKLWNLLKCRCASTMKFADEKTVVAWSPSGRTYAILGNRDVEVWSAQAAERVCVLKHAGKTYTGRTNTFTYLSDDVIVTGGDESVLKAYSSATGAELCAVDTLQANRIRTVVTTNDVAGAARGQFSVVAAFSNGMVQIWEAEVGGGDGSGDEDEDTDEEGGGGGGGGGKQAGLRVTLECVDDLTTAGERLVGIATCLMATPAPDSDGGEDADGEAGGSAAPGRKRKHAASGGGASGGGGGGGGGGATAGKQATGTADGAGSAKKKKKKKKKKNKAAGGEGGGDEVASVAGAAAAAKAQAAAKAAAAAEGSAKKRKQKSKKKKKQRKSAEGEE